LDNFSLYDNIQYPSEIELCEYTFLLPKDLVERFKLLGIERSNKTGRYSVSKRLARYMLCYHKLLTRKDVATLQIFLDLPYIDKRLRDFDNKSEKE